MFATCTFAGVVCGDQFFGQRMAHLGQALCAVRIANLHCILMNYADEKRKEIGSIGVAFRDTSL